MAAVSCDGTQLEYIDDGYKTAELCRIAVIQSG
jgi:hypothetical protein